MDFDVEAAAHQKLPGFLLPWTWSQIAGAEAKAKAAPVCRMRR